MAELDRAAISKRLQDSREEAGFSQNDMAELLKVHDNTIQNWESPKKKTVPFDRMDEWAALTTTSKAWLLHGGATPQAEGEAVLERLAALESLLRDLLRRLPGEQDERQAGSDA